MSTGSNSTISGATLSQSSTSLTSTSLFTSALSSSSLALTSMASSVSTSSLTTGTTLLSSSIVVSDSSTSPTPITSSTPSSIPTPSSTTPIVFPSSTFPSSPISTTTVDSTSVVGTTSVRGSSLPASTTVVVTNYITTTLAGGGVVSSPAISTVIRTVPASIPASTSPTSTGASSSTTNPATIQSDVTSSSSSSGLSTGGVVAIAVVVPVVGIALLVLLGIFLWRKRKQKKTAEEARRKEVEEYGYNPNNDPTLPAVGSTMGGADSPEMSDSNTGYRGWGANTVTSGSARHPSTTLSSGAAAGVGLALSDDGRGHSPGSPPNHGTSEGGRSNDPLMEQQGYHDPAANNASFGMSPAAVGGMAAGGMAAAAGSRGNMNGVHRGLSNASSTYSAAGATDQSDDGRQTHEFGYDTNYSQYAPYRPGNNAQTSEAEPVIQDVSARRQTKLENPSVFPPQGNSGISQNF